MRTHEIFLLCGRPSGCRFSLLFPFAVPLAVRSLVFCRFFYCDLPLDLTAGSQHLAI